MLFKHALEIALVHQSSPSSHPSASKSKFSCLRRFKLSSVPQCPLPSTRWGSDRWSSKPRCADHVEWHQPFLQQFGAFCKCSRPAWKGLVVPLKPTKCHDICHFCQVFIQSDAFLKIPCDQPWNPHLRCLQWFQVSSEFLAGRQISKPPRCCWVRLWAVGWHDHLGPSGRGVGISRV